MTSADPAFVDLLYRGLTVTRKAKLVSDPTGAFLEFETPLPVGTAVAVSKDGQAPQAARVVAVVEHEAAAKGPPGMRLAWQGAEASAAAAAALEAQAEAAETVDAAHAVDAATGDAGRDPLETTGDGAGGGDAGAAEGPGAGDGSPSPGDKRKRKKRK
jgi:hypothetical protein